MDYRNTEMKLDSLIGYFNEKKINLIPPFQRGRVWKLPARQELMKNMVAGRPIPAIFLYKEARGSRFNYNILDGKQRLESLLLFVGNKRNDMKVEQVRNYFFDRKVRRAVNFTIPYGGKEKVAFADLPPDVVRDFREYSIPTIEISLDENSALDEVINLFVDINQYGVKVNRFDIVKAIGDENELLQSVLDLIAVAQRRKQDRFFKRKKSAYTRVLSRLSIIKNLEFDNQVVDRMWERLLEIVLFCRTREHREPRQILKRFITSKDEQKEQSHEEDSAIAPAELKILQSCFGFLADCYKKSELGNTMLATDQPHFYTMVTSFIESDLLLPQVGHAPPDRSELLRKLLAFAKYLPDRAKLPTDRKMATAMKEYKQAAARGTAQTGQREIRQKNFIELIKAL